MPSLRPWTREDARGVLRAPEPDDDKRLRGTVALCTGSPQYPGAAVLGVEGAWRAGAGFVRFLGAQRVVDGVLARRPETVAHPEPSTDAPLPPADAWVIGSGQVAAERDAHEERLLRRILAGSAPVIVDAAAIDLALDAAAPVVVTPHEGEFARLREALGLERAHPDELTDRPGRADLVRETARALGGVVLLKGSRTMVAEPAGEAIVVSSGTPWLAVAGTGDVLAGVIGALVAARPDAVLADLAAAGAWMHGAAGCAAAGADEASIGRPIVALDVAAALPQVIGALLADDDAGVVDGRDAW